MVDLFLYNNPNVILPLETRLAINRLGTGKNQKKWHYREKRAGRKVKERCAKHNKDNVHCSGKKSDFVDGKLIGG